MKKESLPDNLTYGDAYYPAMDITDETEAREYFEILVEHTMRSGHSREEAERMERQNLGYFAASCGPEYFRRVCRLFNCDHPIWADKVIEYRRQ
jgi:hypothetical protein